MQDAITYFDGVQAELASAVLRDNADAVRKAVAGGAKVNAAGREGLTPLLFALSRKKRTALEELLELGGDPNLRADNGDNAVTIAAWIADTEPDYLGLLLSRRGDPNARGPSGEPIAGILIGQRNNDGLRLLASHGADLNALDNTQTPLILQAAHVGYWDTVWTLIELGVNWRTTERGIPLAWIVHLADLTPDSPFYPWWRRTTEFLEENGVSFPPAPPQ